MEAGRFDQLTKSFAAAGTRRGLARLLAALPLLGGLATVLNQEGEANDRRKKRKERHKDRHQQRHSHRDRVRKRKQIARKRHRKRRRQRRQRCLSQPVAQTCAGRCAVVTNNCGVQVDCGPCNCGTCPICKICNASTGECQANSAVVDQPCGSPGQVCQGDGTCACRAGSCASGQRCDGTICVCDGTSASCAAGCCDGTTCHIDDDDACGIGGGMCIPCTGTGETCGGGNPGTPGVCGCTSQGCGAQTCGSTTDNCGDLIPCGGCTGCCAGNSCVADGAQTVAQCGTGVPGDPCRACTNPTPVCVGGNCTTCSAGNPCPSGQCCSGGQCFDTCPTGCCLNGQCVPTCPECLECDLNGDCVAVAENTLCDDDLGLCCGGQCLQVECCDSDFCGGEPCTPNGTCAVTCEDASICDAGGPTCECNTGWGGIGNQPICVDTADCVACVANCADCPSGHVCEDTPGGGSCPPGQHRCCNCCV